MKTTQLTRLKQEISKMVDVVNNKPKPTSWNPNVKRTHENLQKAELGVLEHLWKCIEELENQ